MKLTLHLEADSLEELRIAACSALGLMMPGSPPGIIPPPPEVKLTAAERKKQEARDKLRGALAKKQAAPEPDPQHMEEVYEAEQVARLDAMADRAPEEDEGTGNGIDVEATPLVDVLANEALKKETIAQLGALFAAGKVKVVRSALDKYGKGAKSFPEIDASQFPAIAEALKRGDIA